MRSGSILVALHLASQKRGGTEQYLEALAEVAKSRGCALTVALIEATDDLIRSLGESGARVVVLGRQSPAGLARAVADTARQARADVALLHFFPLYSLTGAALAALGVRVVVVDDHSGGVHRRSPAREVAARGFHRLAGRGVHRVIAVSDFVRRRVLASAHIDEDKVTVVYNGVRAAPTLDDETREALRRSIGVSSHRVFLFAAAHLIPEKGIDTLLDAIARLGPPVRERLALRIAGAGPMEGALSLRAAQLGGDVAMLGQRSDVPSLMASADIVCVPSRWQEAFGFVVAEAMRAGRAVVASDVGGIPELIRHGSTGLLVPPGSSEALADSLTLLIEDKGLRARLGDAARDDAARRFDVGRMAGEMLEQLMDAGEEEKSDAA